MHIRTAYTLIGNICTHNQHTTRTAHTCHTRAQCHLTDILSGNTLISSTQGEAMLCTSKSYTHSLETSSHDQHAHTYSTCAQWKHSRAISTQFAQAMLFTAMLCRHTIETSSSANNAMHTRAVHTRSGNITQPAYN